jgi:hypothetical protein
MWCVSKRGSAQGIVWNPKKRKPLGRPRLSGDDSIKMDVQKVGGSVGDWIEWAHDRNRWRALVITVKNLRFHKNAENLLTDWKDCLAYQE